MISDRLLHLQISLSPSAWEIVRRQSWFHFLIHRHVGR